MELTRDQAMAGAYGPSQRGGNSADQPLYYSNKTGYAYSDGTTDRSRAMPQSGGSSVPTQSLGATPPMPQIATDSTRTTPYSDSEWAAIKGARPPSYPTSGSYPPMPQQGNQNYTVTAGMGMGGTPPPMPTQGAGGTPGFPVKTQSDIAAEAKARTDALLAKQTTLAAQTKQGFQTSYDRLQGQTRDSRVLANADFQRSNDPFSGGTAYRQDMTNREREISDRQASQDLATRFANVDMSLADYTTANDTQRQQMIDDMTAKERSYGLQVDQLALQRRGQDQTQANADRSFGLQRDQFQHGVSQDSIANNHWQNTFDQGANQWDKTFNQNQTNSDRSFNAGRTDATQTQTNADRTFNAGRQDAAANATGYYNPSGMNASQINQEIAKNSTDYANASPEQKQQLHDRNMYLNGLIGKTDSTGNGDYTGGNPNGQVGYRTTQGQILDNQAKEVAYSHARDLIKDAQYQQTFDYNFKKDGLDFALRQATLDNQITNDQAMRTIQLYSAETSRMSANSSAASAASSAGNAAAAQKLAQAKFDYDRDPTNPDNVYKLSLAQKAVADANKADATSVKVDSKTSTNNYYDAIKELQSNKATKDNASRYVESVKDHLSDTDYRNLQKWVENNTFNPKK